MIFCYAAQGYDGSLVGLEVELRRAIPGFDIVGLADNAVRESKERVRAAIHQSGFDFPKERVLINLSPAGIPKIGASYDLAIAAAILQHSGQLKGFSKDYLVMGELGLDGSIKPVRSVLSSLQKSTENGIFQAFIPEGNRKEGLLTPKMQIKCINHLRQFASINSIECLVCREIPVENSPEKYRLDQIKGQKILKRVLSVSVAGKHHCLLFGPPGSGKTLGAHCLPSLMPPLTNDEFLEVSRIWSQSDLRDREIHYRRPFREPHHSASAEGILGGSSEIIPGEISLAHCGVLLLDEALEFNHRVLQGLREPLETGKIRLVRAGKSFWFPADFILILTVNPCACGNLGKKSAHCICSKRELETYWRGLRGPLLDRIDLRLPVEPISSMELILPEESSEMDYLQWIHNARSMQLERFSHERKKNGSMNVKEISEYCGLSSQGEELLKTSSKNLGLSSRACHSVLKVARTLADMNMENRILEEHLLEAISYRRYGESNIYWKKL